MTLPNRPQMVRLKWPLTASQVEALDSMLEQLFRASKRSTSLSLSAGTLAGRNSATDGPVEEITLGANLAIVGSELQVTLAGDTLDGLSDVDLTAPANGDLLQYNSGTGMWENITVDDLFFNAGVKWELVSDGSPDPELIFAGGEPVYIFIP